MTFVRRSVFAAPLLAVALGALVALVALGGCSSDGKSLSPSSAPVPDGVVTSSIATSDRGSTVTAAGEGGTSGTTLTSRPAIVTSSVVTGSTTAPGATTVAGLPAIGAPTTTGAGDAATDAATNTATDTATNGSTNAAPAGSAAASTVAGGAPASTTPGVGGTVPDDTTPTSTGNPTAFCAFEADIDDATNTDDDQVFLAALRSFEPKMTQWEADAPTVQLRFAASKLHAATKNAIAANTPDAFDGQALNDAFIPIARFCGNLAGPST